MGFTEACDQMKASGFPTLKVAHLMRDMAYYRMLKRELPRETALAFQQAGIAPLTIVLPPPSDGGQRMV